MAWNTLGTVGHGCERLCPTFLFTDSVTSMNEVEKILVDIVAARSRRYNRAIASDDAVSDDDKEIVFIELLQASLDLAKWREENQPLGVN